MLSSQTRDTATTSDHRHQFFCKGASILHRMNTTDRPSHAGRLSAAAPIIMQGSLHPPSHRQPSHPAGADRPPPRPPLCIGASILQRTDAPGQPARAIRLPPRHSYCKGTSILHRTDTLRGSPARTARPQPRPPYCTGASILHRTDTHRRLPSSYRPSSDASTILHGSRHPPSHRHAPPATQLVPPVLRRVHHIAREPPSSIAQTRPVGPSVRAACTPGFSIMLRNLHTPPHYHSPRSQRPFY
jgi:hypothetical protein